MTQAQQDAITAAQNKVFAASKAKDLALAICVSDAALVQEAQMEAQQSFLKGQDLMNNYIKSKADAYTTAQAKLAADNDVAAQAFTDLRNAQAELAAAQQASEQTAGPETPSGQ